MLEWDTRYCLELANVIIYSIFLCKIISDIMNGGFSPYEKDIYGMHNISFSLWSWLVELFMDLQINFQKRDGPQI